ncbi:MAG TPA: DUF3857 domain-containing protein [Candidatus Polarisedimenticolaceae bacterium]
MKLVSRLLVVVLATTLLPAAPAGTPKRKPAELLLKDEYPPITDADKQLASVPFEPGAPAAMLLYAEQRQLLVESDDLLQRVHVYRRVKILDAAGVEDYGDFEFEAYGRWRLQKVEARTVLPDGKIVDAASGIFREQSKGTTHETERNQLRVAWPEVRPGAILDLHLSYIVDEIPNVIWPVQLDLPVLDNRLMFEVDGGFGFSTLGIGLSQEETAVHSFRSARGMAHVWHWTDVPSLSGEPHSPPESESPRQLIVYPREYKTEGYSEQWAVEWAPWTKRQYEEFWTIWAKRKVNATTALAKEVAGSLATPLEKAEAVRKVLRERLRVSVWAYGVTAPSPDDVLAQGSGSSTEIAATAVAMLKAVDVPAELVAYRRRASGPLPPQVPLPILLDAGMFRFAGEKGPVYVDPLSDNPAGPVPTQARGVFVIPFDGKTTAPVRLGEIGVADNRLVNVVRGKLDATGRLELEGTFTEYGLAAERGRNAVRDLDDAARRERVQRRLRRHMPGAEIVSLQFDGLDGDKQLKTVVKWTVEGYAVPAGKRILVNLNLLDRMDPADWAAETRRNDVYFGEPFDRTDTVLLELPEGATAAVPQGLDAAAPPVGKYTSTQAVVGRSVSNRRLMRLEMPRVPAAAYATLKNWLRDIAKTDDQPVVVTLP